MRGVLVLVGLSVLCTGVTLQGQGKTAAPQLVITSAASDPLNGQIVINGRNFGDIAAEVTIEGVELPIVGWSPTQIIAMYAVSTTPAGTYLLIVSKGPAAVHSDAFHLAFGAAGPKGDKGEAGAPGVNGDKGDTGDVGATGAVGAAGPAGPTRATGERGPAGPAGVTGAAGPTGATGATGPQGPAGPAGPQGLAGNLALGGKACPAGQFVAGFDAAGQLTCAAPAGPQALRATVMVCGRTDRDVSTFIPAGASLNVVAGCTPDSTTQALVITRYGFFTAADLRPYVEAGGIVITEFAKSTPVYNAVFEAGLTAGFFSGGCQDAVNPIVQMSASDPFWTANAPFTATPEDESGCGYDMSHFPEITPLGGWSSTSVSLAYRTLGSGRVWFVEADWSDNQTDFTSSNRLMGYMITHR